MIANETIFQQSPNDEEVATTGHRSYFNNENSP